MPTAGGPPLNNRASKRRSSRIKLKIPILIQAGEMALQAETVSVSKHGAKIRVIDLKQKLACGEQLQVGMRAGQKRVPARVVWLGKTSEPHCGIELEHEGNFWGMYFPGSPDAAVRPARPAPVPPAAADLPKPIAAAAQAVAVSLRPTAASTLTKPVAEVCAKPRTAPPARINGFATHTLPVTVTGFSAVRMPLSEKVEAEFTRPDEATALLRDLVEPGTAVRLLFSAGRVVMGRVAAIGAERQAGKWRVRIKCEAPCF